MGLYPGGSACHYFCHFCFTKYTQWIIFIFLQPSWTENLRNVHCHRVCRTSSYCELAGFHNFLLAFSVFLALSGYHYEEL